MAQTLSAPSTVSVGSQVYYPDGTTTTVDANGNIACPDNFVGAMLNAGYNFAASDAGQQSSAVSSIAVKTIAGSSQASSIAALTPASTSSQASSIATAYTPSASSQASSMAALTPASVSSQASSWAAIATTVSSVASRTKSSFSW